MGVNQLIKKIQIIAREMGARNLVVGAAGNISSRLDGQRVLISKKGADFNRATESDFVEVAYDGTLLSLEGTPTSEKDLHLHMYQRPDINAVIHTHSPYATAVAVLRKPIPQIVDEMGFVLGGEVRVAPYAQPGTLELARQAVATLEDRMGILLANHGVLSVGRDLDEALKVAILIEHVAFIYLMASSAQSEVFSLPMEAVDHQNSLFRRRG